MNGDRGFHGRANVPILVMSLVLSVILWAVVTTQESTTSKDVVIGLQYSNLSSKLALDNPLPDMSIHVSGPAEALKGITNDKYRGMVDLRDAHPAKHVYTVGLPYDLQNVAVPNLPKINLVIEPMDTETETVQTGISGRLRDPNVILVERDALPHKVKVSGPHSHLAQVAQARVNIDLSKVQPDEAEPYNGYIQLYDSHGSQLNQTELGLSVEPLNCVVHLGFIAAPVKKPAFVYVVFKSGSRPDDGYRVDGYEVTPPMVTITGSSLALATTTQVQTEPVDLTGLSASHQFTVKVILPAGVSESIPRTVKVRVSVRPTQKSPRT